MLLREQYQVRIVDVHPPPLQELVEFVKADLISSHLDASLFTDINAVIHLAGKNIFGRWTRRFKEEMYRSRIESTRNIVSCLGKLHEPPQIFVSASAVGYYGDRGEEELIESSSAGDDFLAHLCIDWEQATYEAVRLGIRTVHIRTAPVRGPGGFLGKILPLFKAGLGGTIGNGRQWFPWIHIEDIVGAYLFALEHEVDGPVNACAPQPVRFHEFVCTLVSLLHRPALVKVPQWILHALCKDLADALTTSQRVLPQRLLAVRFPFQYPNLTEALQHILKR